MAARTASFGIRTITSTAREGLANSGVHIRVYPRPRNLAESREILRVLEEYGEVVMYKHLKYEPQAPAPNTILAIYQSPSSAQKLINTSPFKFKLKLEDTGWAYAGSEALEQVEAISTDTQAASEQKSSSFIEEDVNDEEGSSSDKAQEAARSIRAEENGFQGFGGSGRWGDVKKELKSTAKPSSDQVLPPKGYLVDPMTLPAPAISEDQPGSSSSTSPQASKSTPLPVREFNLYVTPSNFNHQAYIERQGYYANFVPDRKTIMAQDLEGRVPLEGLFDCRINKQEVPLRMRNNRKAKGPPESFSLKALWDSRKP